MALIVIYCTTSWMQNLDLILFFFFSGKYLHTSRLTICNTVSALPFLCKKFWRRCTYTFVISTYNKVVADYLKRSSLFLKLRCRYLSDHSSLLRKSIAPTSLWYLWLQRPILHFAIVIFKSPTLQCARFNFDVQLPQSLDAAPIKMF